MIHLIDNTDTFKSWRTPLKAKSIGFVPTMGNLHQGHLSLIEKSLQENEQTIVSIFINPLQFGANEDFDRYPRTLEKDLETLKALSSNQKLTVFAPHQFYLPRFATAIEVKSTLTKKLCGASRPHHFSGVTTVVYLLFSLIRPSQAYFGQKDYQQFKIIEKMTTDLSLPVQLKVLPTVRDSNGLALSSRNQYLTPQEYDKALILNKTLKKIASGLIAGDNWHPLLSQHSWDYMEALNAENLENVTPHTKKILIAGALRIGNIRLIDNIIVNKDA